MLRIIVLAFACAFYFAPPVLAPAGLSSVAYADPAKKAAKKAARKAKRAERKAARKAKRAERQAARKARNSGGGGGGGNTTSSGIVASGDSLCVYAETVDEYRICRLPYMITEVIHADGAYGYACTTDVARNIVRHPTIVEHWRAACDVNARLNMEWEFIERARDAEYVMQEREDDWREQQINARGGGS